TKDGLNARLDMVEMEIRIELALTYLENGTFLPVACFTFSKRKKRQFCKILSQVKVPDGYSSNIRSCVQLKDSKLVNLKSHDCHVLMQQLLPIAIRDTLPKQLRNAITRLCFFFNALCSKVVDPSVLDTLQR